LVLVGLLYVAAGVLLIVGSTRQAETGSSGIVLAIAGAVVLVVWLVVAGIGLGLFWAMSARSVVAWLITLGLLGIGLRFYLPLAVGHPLGVGLNPESVSSSGPPDPLRLDWLRWLAVAVSPDVHVAVIIGMAILLLWPSSLAWFFGRKPILK